MPMPAIIERVDRKFAALYRGADLSTMSSNDGEGTGASLQGEEKEILLRDDAEVITETLERVSRRVIQWNFGWGVEPAARLEMIVPTDEDGQFLLDASCTLADRGAPVSLQSTMDRLSIQAADEGEDLLLPAAGNAAPANPDPHGESEQVSNTATATDGNEEFDKTARALLDRARREDLRGLGDEMLGLLDLEDPEEFIAVARDLDARLPDHINGRGYSERVWEAIHASALANGWGEDERPAMENGDKPGHPFRGNQWTDADGNPRRDAGKSAIGRWVDDVLDADDNEHLTLDYETLSDAEASRLEMLIHEGGGSDVDMEGYTRALDNYELKHVMKSHGNAAKESARGQIAVTREDLKAIPKLISKAGKTEYAGKTPQGRDAVRHYIFENGTTTILEEVRTRHRKLVAAQVMKFRGRVENVPTPQRRKRKTGDE